MKAKILLAEDDAALRTGVRDALANDGYDVTAVGDGTTALQKLQSEDFAIAVLDISMPRKSGFEVCKEARRAGIETPILFLTVRGDEIDKVLGFEIGADDYVTKPFSLRELLARIAALLRRGRPGAKSTAAILSKETIGACRVDFDAFTITKNGIETTLPPKEAGMLKLLIANEGSVVSRETFLTKVWGSALFTGPRTVDTHMGRLRMKIEDDPESPKYLLTAHGVGYRLVR
ncbi:MAG: response regulator transcription factor [Planctomycetota bacterium]